MLSLQETMESMTEKLLLYHRKGSSKVIAADEMLTLVQRELRHEMKLKDFPVFLGVPLQELSCRERNTKQKIQTMRVRQSVGF